MTVRYHTHHTHQQIITEIRRHPLPMSPALRPALASSSLGHQNAFWDVGTLGCLFRISSSTTSDTSVYLLHMENHDGRNPCLTRTGSRFQWYFSNCLEQTACWRKDLGILPKSEYSTSHAVLPLIKSTDHAILSMLPISFCFLQSCIRLSP